MACPNKFSSSTFHCLKLYPFETLTLWLRIFAASKMFSGSKAFNHTSSFLKKFGNFFAKSTNSHSAAEMLSTYVDLTGINTQLGYLSHRLQIHHHFINLHVNQFLQNSFQTNSNWIYEISFIGLLLSHQLSV